MSASESTGFAAPTDESVAGLVAGIEQRILAVTSLRERLTAVQEHDIALDREIATALSTLAAERDEACEALDGIYIYCNDTLSGRSDGAPDDRTWQRDAVVHARNLARPFSKERPDGI